MAPITQNGRFVRTTFKTFTDRRTGKKHELYDDQGRPECIFGIFYIKSLVFGISADDAEHKGKNNAQTLFGVFEIPADYHIRSRLDAVVSAAVYPLFDFVFDGLQSAGVIDSFRMAGNRLLLA